MWNEVSRKFLQQIWLSIMIGKYTPGAVLVLSYLYYLLLLLTDRRLFWGMDQGTF